MVDLKRFLGRSLKVRFGQGQNRQRQQRWFRLSSQRIGFGSLRWGLLSLMVAIALWACNSVPPQGGQSVAAADSGASLDPNIRNLRTGDLVIQVVNGKREPLTNVSVKLEQTAHAFQFGTALSTDMFNGKANPIEQSQYLKLASQLFNSSVHENALKWYSTEPVKGQVSYADADRILGWSQSQQFKMRGHTLFWAPEQWNQDWVKALSPTELKVAAQQRATEICTRYRDRIPDYDVFNEPLHGDLFQKRLGEQIIDEMFQWCHNADPEAQLYVNEFNILNGQELDRYVQLIRTLLDRGVPLHGIGVQGHIRENISAERIKQSLDTLAQLGLPIKITEFDAVAETEEEQARILTDVYRVAFAHPAIAGILMWGFWEGAHWEPKAAIFDRNFAPKPAAKAYQDLVYGEWWTRVNDKTNRRGEILTRAFFGNYRVTVETKSGTVVQTFNFAPSDQPLRMVVVL